MSGTMNTKSAIPDTEHGSNCEKILTLTTEVIIIYSIQLRSC